MKAIIVTGSRGWDDLGLVQRALNAAKANIVIHGDAKGADRLARQHVASRGFADSVPMPAQWDRDGRAAGPMRNQRMLDVLLALQLCGYEVEVHAFPLPSSKGTWSMVNLARAADVAVHVHRPTGAKS